MKLSGKENQLKWNVKWMNPVTPAVKEEGPIKLWPQMVFLKSSCCGTLSTLTLMICRFTFFVKQWEDV